MADTQSISVVVASEAKIAEIAREENDHRYLIVDSWVTTFDTYVGTQLSCLETILTCSHSHCDCNLTNVLLNKYNMYV